MQYTLLKGNVLDISCLAKGDLQFLLDLCVRAMNNEDYFELQRLICGPNAYPLKGAIRMRREIHDSILYQAAEDIVDRVGIRQGVILPDKDDEAVPTDMIVGIAEAARMLGISRSAVIKAAQKGRIKGKKIGGAWALIFGSVQSYRVAPFRIAAGRAAHKSSSPAQI